MEYANLTIPKNTIGPKKNQTTIYIRFQENKITKKTIHVHSKCNKIFCPTLRKIGLILDKFGGDLGEFEIPFEFYI